MQIGEPTNIDKQEMRRRTWLIVELRDETDAPVPNEEFELLRGRKIFKRGRLDDSGRTEVADLPPGAYWVRFPKRWNCKENSTRTQ